MESRIKILYVTVSMELGGTERQLCELAVGLDPRRFQPHVCCLRGGGAFVAGLTRSGIPVAISKFAAANARLRWKPVFFCAQVHELSRLMREMQPSVVHGMLPTACVTAGFASKIAGVPVLVTGRRSLGYYKDGHFLLRQMENLVCRWTDLAVANSEAVKTDTLRRERIATEKVRVIYNGVRIPERSPSKGWEELIGERIEGPVVCLVANFFPYKGHMDFLRAASIVLKSFPDVKFLLVGDGRLRSDIEHAIADLGIAGNVILAGSRIDACEIMGASDVVVLCSHEEGFPNVLLEAMAAGKPVVATRVGGAPEIVEEGRTGLLTPPRDPDKLASGIVRLLGDRRESEKMGKRGFDLVRSKFTIARMVRSYEDLYTELIHSKLKTSR